MNPLFAASALSFSFKQVSTEGFFTMTLLAIVSLLSWSVIISKAFQLSKARRVSTKFFLAFRAAKDPLEIARAGTEFDGAPAFEIYRAAAEELDAQLNANPVMVKGTKRISHGSFDLVKMTLERTAGAEARAGETRARARYVIGRLRREAAEERGRAGEREDRLLQHIT